MYRKCITIQLQPIERALLVLCDGITVETITKIVFTKVSIGVNEIVLYNGIQHHRLSDFIEYT